MAKIYLESTTVSASKSLMEIQEIVLRSGATNINQKASNGRILGLAFTLPGPQGDMLYDLPARIEPIYKTLRAQRSPRSISRPGVEEIDRDAAERIAWRQLLYWIRAQFALIETGMVEAQEVFLPYMMARNGQRLFEHVKAGALKQLTGGGDR
jgi:hypothetical protein